MALSDEKVEQLLSEVQKVRAFYDPKHINYKNSSYLHKEWERIAKDLNITVKTIRQKWKNLLASMRAEMKKHPKPRSGDAASSSSKPKWKWYTSMLFVAAYQRPKASSGNLTKALQQADNQQQPLDSLDDEANMVDQFDQVDEPSLVEEVEVTAQAPPAQIKILSTEVVQSSSEKFQRLNRIDIDDDELYFETLLIDVARMNRVQKIHFRNQIMELVLRFSHGRTGTLEEWHI